MWLNWGIPITTHQVVNHPVHPLSLWDRANTTSAQN